MKKLLSIIALLPCVALGQQKDKATFIEVKPGYYQNSILKGIYAYEKNTKSVDEKHTVFKIDLAGKDLPGCAE